MDTGFSLTNKHYQALRQLELSFSNALQDEIQKQTKYRAIALAIILANTAVSIHLIRSYLLVKAGLSSFTSGWSIFSLPFFCFVGFIYFFSNSAFRENLFCVKLFLKRINSSLSEFNLVYCKKTHKLIYTLQ